jgi:hypothetical protein
MWTAGTSLGCGDQETNCFHNTLPTVDGQSLKRMKGRGECVGLFKASADDRYKVLFPCEKKLYLACEDTYRNIQVEIPTKNVSIFAL